MCDGGRKEVVDRPMMYGGHDFSTRRLGNAWKRHQKRRGKSGGSWLKKCSWGGEEAGMLE